MKAGFSLGRMPLIRFVFRRTPKMGTRVFLGFGAVLVLLLLLGASSWYNASTSLTGVSMFSQEAATAALSARGYTSLLETRVALAKYVRDGVDGDPSAVLERGKEAAGFLEDAKRRMTVAANQAFVDEVLQSHQEFLHSVDSLVAARRKKADALAAADENGQGALSALTDIGAALETAGRTDAARAVATAREKLLDARLAVAQVVGFNAIGETARVADGVTAARTALDGVADVDPAIKGAAAKIAAFGDSAAALMDAASAEADLIDIDLAVNGERIGAKSQQIRDMGAGLQERFSSEAADVALDGQRATLVLTLAALVVGLAMALAIGQAISRPLRTMTAAMGRLADGDTDAPVPAVGRTDEIGAMAKAVQVFKDNILRIRTLGMEQDRQKRQAEQERRAMLLQLADSIESSVKNLAGSVNASADAMHGTARTLRGLSGSTADQASSAAEAAERMHENVHGAAAAAEELSATTAEISRQVQRAATVAKSAVEQAGMTTEVMNGMATAATRIGEVVGLIEGIAAQTNLLALNATIEAARAGEAGRGFAIVAGEVKRLATQTAAATNEIGQQIGAVQSTSTRAVEAIKVIVDTITAISDISSGIASAVTEQTAATHEIARNVGSAADASDQVAHSVGSVRGAAGQTGVEAEEVLQAAGALSEHAHRLDAEVSAFVARIRQG